MIVCSTGTFDLILTVHHGQQSKPRLLPSPRETSPVIAHRRSGAHTQILYSTKGTVDQGEYGGVVRTRNLGVEVTGFGDMRMHGVGARRRAIPLCLLPNHPPECVEGAQHFDTNPPPGLFGNGNRCGERSRSAAPTQEAVFGGTSFLWGLIAWDRYAQYICTRRSREERPRRGGWEDSDFPGDGIGLRPWSWWGGADLPARAQRSPQTYRRRDWHAATAHAGPPVGATARASARATWGTLVGQPKEIRPNRLSPFYFIIFFLFSFTISGLEFFFKFKSLVLNSNLL